MESRRSARLKDVANASGVHVSTVSRVLAGDTGQRISPETRQRIYQTALDLNYQPNAMARGLKLATTGALGLLIPSLRNLAEIDIVRGAFHRAWERGFVVLLAEDADEGSARAAYQRLVEEGRIDGVLIASARIGSPLVERFAVAEFPSVFINRRHAGRACSVSMNEERAGELAAQHLLELGHREIVLLADREDIDTARRIGDSFLARVTATAPAPLVVHTEFSEESACRAVSELMRSRRPPTAIFALNLNQALGALAGARHARVAIPDDVTIVTCDDDIILEFLDVPLTAIRMPVWDLGVAGVDALLSILDGEAPNDVVVAADPELIVRASSAVPRHT